MGERKRETVKERGRGRERRTKAKEGKVVVVVGVSFCRFFNSITHNLKTVTHYWSLFWFAFTF